MVLSWSERALDDLESVRTYLTSQHEAAAGETVLRILTHLEHLKTQPHLGRPGRVPGTRELLMHPAPFIVPYRVREDVIEVLLVLHTSRAWPDEF